MPALRGRGGERHETACYWHGARLVVRCISVTPPLLISAESIESDHKSGLRGAGLFDLFEPLELGLGGVILVEGIATADEPVARAGGAIAESPADGFSDKNLLPARPPVLSAARVTGPSGVLRRTQVAASSAKGDFGSSSTNANSLPGLGELWGFTVELWNLAAGGAAGGGSSERPEPFQYPIRRLMRRSVTAVPTGMSNPARVQDAGSTGILYRALRRMKRLSETGFSFP